MWDWRKWERRRLVNFYFIAFSGIMRTSIANFLLFRRFWEKRKEEFLRKGGGKGAMALLELSCLFFFISIRLLFSIPPYGVRYSKCGVSIIWTLLRDHAPSVRCAARITHWHWQFSCNTDIFSHRLFFFFFLRPVINTCASCNVFSDNITSLIFTTFVTLESIYPFTFVSTSKKYY